MTFSSADATRARRTERTRSWMIDVVPRARSESPCSVPSVEASTSSRRLASSAAALDAWASRVTSSLRSSCSRALEPESSTSSCARRDSNAPRRVANRAWRAARRSVSTSA